MLINTKLPLKINYLQKQDQTQSLAGMTWTDSEKFNAEEYLGYRVSYFNGVITLVSPSKNHERIAQTIAILLAAYCRKFNLPYFPLGSTRLENKPLAGKEPDVSFAFYTDKDIPDLAIASANQISDSNDKSEALTEIAEVAANLKKWGQALKATEKFPSEDCKVESLANVLTIHAQQQRPELKEKEEEQQ